jgi:hypothetical protein
MAAHDTLGNAMLLQLAIPLTAAPYRCSVDIARRLGHHLCLEMLSFFSGASSFVVPTLVPTTPAQAQHAQAVSAAAITQKYAESMPKGFPTTMLVADETYANPLEKSTFGIPTAAGDMYQGGSSTLSLSAMLDEIPVSDLDPKGEEGIKADLEGVARLKARQAEEAAQAAAKFQEDLAAGRLD